MLSPKPMVAYSKPRNFQNSLDDGAVAVKSRRRGTANVNAGLTKIL